MSVCLQMVQKEQVSNNWPIIYKTFFRVVCIVNLVNLLHYTNYGTLNGSERIY